jgi:hypothetical protein
MKSWHTFILVLWLIGMLTACSFGTPKSTPNPQQPHSSATPSVIPKPLPAQDIANLLNGNTLPGTSVEIDAYYNGSWQLLLGPAADKVAISKNHCPIRHPALTDTLMYGYLYDLGLPLPNAPLATDEYLIAVDLTQARQSDVPGIPDFPFHARLRGHLGDPAFADCAEAERIFVVEQIVRVYTQNVPLSLLVVDPPKEFSSWTRHRDTQYGFTIPVAPDWTTTTLDEPNLLTGVKFVPPAQLDSTVTVRVYPQDKMLDPYDLESAPFTRIPMRRLLEQGKRFGSQLQTQKLSGEVAVNQTDTERVNIVVFKQNGKMYVLELRYRLGRAADQNVLTKFVAMVEGFRLE